MESAVLEALVAFIVFFLISFTQSALNFTDNAEFILFRFTVNLC